jgi:hypothetical protein
MPTPQRLRNDVRLANWRMRVFFLSTVFVIGGLAIASLVTVIVGLNVTVSYGTCWSIVHSALASSTQITVNCLEILLNPNSTATIQEQAVSLVDDGQQLSFYLYSIEFGNPSFGVTNPIINDNTTAEFKMITPLAVAVQTAINNISQAILVQRAQFLTPLVAAAINVLMAVQPDLVLHFNNLNTSMQTVLREQVHGVQAAQITLMSAILGLLLFLTLCVYLPLEYRNRSTFFFLSVTGIPFSFPVSFCCA